MGDRGRGAQRVTDGKIERHGAQRDLRRAIITDGAVGAVPDWYLLIRAARYLGVPPWVLAEAPIYWMEWATIAQNAENEAQNELQRRANGHTGG